MRVASVIGVIVCATAFATAGCGGDEEAGSTDEAIVVGVSEPQTGVGAAAGGAIVEAIELATSEINQAGGIDGRKIELAIEDNATDPAQCTTVAQKLVASEASAIIGAWASACTLATIPVTSRAEMPLVVETSSAPSITDPEESGGPWTFRMSPPSTMNTAVLAGFLPELDISSAFLLAENTDFGLGANEAYEHAFDKMGVEVVGSANFPQDAQTFRDQVTKAIAADADVWALTTEVEQVAQILREASGQGADAHAMAGGGSVNPAHVIELAGADVAEGLMATMYFPQFDPSISGDPEAAKAFVEKWKSAGNDLNLLPEAARGYAAMYVLADAFKRASDPSDPEAVREALEQVDIKSIIYGHVKFEDWCGLENQNQATIYLTRVKDGKVTLEATAEPPYECP